MNMVNPNSITACHALQYFLARPVTEMNPAAATLVAEMACCENPQVADMFIRQGLTGDITEEFVREKTLLGSIFRKQGTVREDYFLKYLKKLSLNTQNTFADLKNAIIKQSKSTAKNIRL